MLVKHLIDGAIGGDYLHSHSKSAAYDWANGWFEIRLRTHHEFEQWRETWLFLCGAVKGEYEIALDGKHPRCHQAGFHGIFLKSWLNSPFSQAPRKTPVVKMTMSSQFPVPQATFARWHADAETRTASGEPRNHLLYSAAHVDDGLQVCPTQPKPFPMMIQVGSPSP